MAEKFFEIAFSGVIKPDADLQTVKQKLGMMFKADAARLQQMFSGKRVYIKRRADEITMIKYRGAFQKAGAICEVVELSDEAPATVGKAVSTQPASDTAGVSDGADYQSKYPESEQLPQALMPIPLAVEAAQIKDLDLQLAAVGSAMLDEYVDPPEPQIDIDGIDLAPVGSDLGPGDSTVVPPPPDTSGLALAD